MGLVLFGRPSVGIFFRAALVGREATSGDVLDESNRLQIQYATIIFRLQTANPSSLYNTSQIRNSLQIVFNFFHFYKKNLPELCSGSLVRSGIALRLLQCLL
jgi:hypothetical protein